ncbi:flagellar protein FliT [Peribacillus asahii]|uniref:flagellar protein FliT n=1 Tax=Peribacillus asahii TaxID=228899 RepID=UPI00382330B7
MEAIQTFYDKTVLLIALLKKENMDRDARIEQVQVLLNEREGLLESIQPPFTEEETRLGKQLVVLDEQVLPLLNQHKVDIQKDLKQLAVKKESNKKYVDPYSMEPVDGVFYDKRN